VEHVVHREHAALREAGDREPATGGDRAQLAETRAGGIAALGIHREEIERAVRALARTRLAVDGPPRAAARRRGERCVGYEEVRGDAERVRERREIGGHHHSAVQQDDDERGTGIADCDRPQPGELARGLDHRHTARAMASSSSGCDHRGVKV
jgi:hypothetical protein